MVVDVVLVTWPIAVGSWSMGNRFDICMMFNISHIGRFDWSIFYFWLLTELQNCDRFCDMNLGDSFRPLEGWPTFNNGVLRYWYCFVVLKILDFLQNSFWRLILKLYSLLYTANVELDFFCEEHFNVLNWVDLHIIVLIITLYRNEYLTFLKHLLEDRKELLKLVDF